MIKYIVKRLFYGVITLWVIITLTFLLMHSIPGSPFSSDELDKMSPAVVENLEKNFGLDKPLHEQYLMYLKNLAKGELGVSISYSPKTVSEVISRGLPISFSLGISSVIFSIIIGIVLGVFAALRQGKWQDNFVKVLTALGITIPGFVLATMLIYIFGVKLRMLPFIGLKEPSNYILPVMAMSGGSIAYLARLTRSSLLDVIRQDYVRTAKAKGLGRIFVIYRRALKNALLPVVTYIGPLVSSSLIGSFVIEKIFAIPGIGREMVDAIGNRDFMMILGLTFFYSAILVITFIVVDITYAFIDPRIKLES